MKTVEEEYGSSCAERVPMRSLIRSTLGLRHLQFSDCFGPSRVLTGDLLYPKGWIESTFGISDAACSWNLDVSYLSLAARRGRQMEYM